MTLAQFAGAAILLAVFATMFGMTAQREGLRAAVGIWLASLATTALVVIGAVLLVGAA